MNDGGGHIDLQAIRVMESASWPPCVQVLRTYVWQGQDWSNLLQAYGCQVWFVVVYATDERPLGFAMLQEYSLLGTMSAYWRQGHTVRGRLLDVASRFLRVLHGPVVCQPESAEIVHEAFCSYLRQLDHRKRYVEIQVAPPYYDDARLPFGLLSNIYQRYGFREERQYTFVVHSDQPLDVLRKRLAREKRTKLNQAAREGIRIDEAVDHAGVERHWRVRCENNRRNQQPIVPLHHYIDTWDTLRPAGAIEVFISHCQGHDLASQMLYLSKTDVELVNVAVSDYNIEHSLPGNDALQWYVLQWAHEHGFLNVDYRGAHPNTTDPKLKGIHNFQKSWGGELVEYQQFIRQGNNLRSLLYRAMQNARRLLKP